MRALPVDWDEYGAERPTLEALAAMSSLLNQYSHRDQVPVHVGASPDGGVAAVFGSDIRRVTVEIANSGEILVAMSAGRDTNVREVARNKDSIEGLIHDTGIFLSL
ncbi:MAG: hypothetical protein KF785_10865 [Gemmatimonadales bacterium]|nr:hypothetical protein [Gemmatimonadales bacterium]